MPAKAIHLHGKPLGSGRFPVICAPLVGRTGEQLLAEAAAVAAKKPDLLEWRVDFFEGIADTAAVVQLAARIKQAAGGMPLLFTRRSSREGGEKIDLAEEQVIDLYRAVCEGGQVDFVDFEMGNDPGHVRQVRELSRASGVQLVLSFHDFLQTPGVDFLNQRFAQAQSLGADIAKVAVMPRNMDDVLTLLAATLQSSRTLAIPVIEHVHGRARRDHAAVRLGLRFRVDVRRGGSASAPGQLPIEDLEAGLAVLRKACGPPLTAGARPAPGQ